MSAPDTIVVMRSPGETRSALLHGETVIEVVHRRDTEIAAGSARMGRVVGHAPGYAFIDIGAREPGVLKVKAPLVEGSKLPVRIVVPPRSGKGAELARAEREAPAPDPAAVWWLRDRESIAHILVTPAAELRRLKSALPDAPLKDGGHDPFADHGIDAAIEAACEPMVPLPGGARLIIEPTAAAICIDIDAGAARPAEANAAAIVAVADHLRLRNLAGHILIDVIPGARDAARAFSQGLKDAVVDDPVPVQIAGITPLGMVELTRQRVGLSLAEVLADAPANQVYAVLRQAVRIAFAERAARIRIEAPAEVIARLQTDLRPALDEARAMAACDILLEHKSVSPLDRAVAKPF